MSKVRHFINALVGYVRKTSAPTTRYSIYGPGKKHKIIKPIRGWRGEIYFKSKMEANVYRFYKYTQKRYNRFHKVEYEPEIFFFNSNRYGIRAYIPDIKITSPAGVRYIEVKGYVSSSTIKKDRLFSEDYSGLKLYYILPPTYKVIERLYASKIKDWEY